MLLFESDSNNLAICVIITVGMQFAFFLVACTCKFDKVPLTRDELSYNFLFHY